MADEGFEEAQGWSQDEVVGLPDVFGEAAGTASRWGTGRRAAVAVGIAVALGAGGYGIAVADGGSSPAASGAAAVPVSVSSSASGGGSAPMCGAAFTRGVTGTLESDNGSTLTVQGPDSSAHTVTTTSSTVAVRVASGSVAGIANGDKVLVGGSYANNTVTAKTIVTGSGLDQLSAKAPQGSISWIGRGFASGTVADKTSAGFTVVTSDGAHVKVATSSSPTVETFVKISVGALRVGQRVVASGAPGSNGAISATQVEELDSTAMAGDPGFGLGLGFGFGFGPGFGFGFGLRGSGPGPRAFAPPAPSTAPSGAPQLVKPSNAPGFGFRGRAKGLLPCGSGTAGSSAPYAPYAPFPRGHFSYAPLPGAGA